MTRSLKPTRPSGATSVAGVRTGRRLLDANETTTTTPARTAGLPDVAKLLAAALAQTAVAAGLLFYFGWARAAATYGYFGLDSSMVPLSRDDYLLRSVDTALPPLLLGALAAGALLTVLALAGRAIRRAERGRWAAALSIQGVAALLLAAGTYASFRPIPIHVPTPAPPLVAATGALIALGSWPAVRAATTRASHPPVVATTLLMTIAAAALVWSWSLHANNVGLARARHLIADLPYKDAVALYSAKPLAISGPGVNAVRLTRTGSAYTVRYDGLRLLVRANNGDLFLLPVGWRPGRDPVFRIPDDKTIRIDIVARTH